MTASVTARRGLTAQELEQARLLLQQARNSVAGATRGLSEAQWRFRPAPGRWTVAEILEHIVTVQEGVVGPILEQLANAPAPPADFDYKQVDAVVIHQFPTRLARFSAPEFFHPAGTAPSDALRRLEVNTVRLAAALEDNLDLRGHAAPAPPLKAISGGAFELMDGYQWILAAATHTERHVKQMLEVMADPAYPGA